ncbi:MAG: hypothetical protein DRJ42_31355, partial [Deltaproteobacteria bacterium]
MGPASYRTERGDIWQAPNRAFDLRLYLDDEDGLEVIDRSAEGTPTLVRLRLEGWGRQGRLKSSKASSLSEREGGLRRQRGGLAEQYENGAAGVQLGWEIGTRPKGDGPLVIALRIQEASARPRGGGIELRSQSGRSLVLQAALATDASGKRLSAEMAIEPGGLLELRIDDTEAVYPLQVKSLITGSVDALIEADQEDALLGVSVASAGDVNGDGFADVIVGAYGYDNGESNEGIALVFLGSAAGIAGSSPADAHAVLESNQAGASLGVSVASAGDVNGDGFDDVIVGAFNYDNVESGEGIALVFHGSAAGITGSSPSDAHALLEADQPGARLGVSVASAGDVNGDGFSDVIVGAFHYNILEGIALVFLGSAAGITGSSPADAHAVIESDWDLAALGTSVASAGDVNGDGFADIIVGADAYTFGESNEGIALVFLGSAAGITGTSPADAHALIEANQAEARLGDSVASAGDVNGDGFADVIVGAWLYDNGEANEGVALVFLGSAAGITGSSPSDAYAMIEAGQDEAHLGTSVVSAGDVNGDGFSDVIVGADRYDNGESNEGVALVFYGSGSGITGSSPADAHALIEGESAWDQFGVTVASAGDVNGDGFADVIVGAPYYGSGIDQGAVWVFLGSPGGITASSPADAHFFLESDQTNAFLGESIASAGDVNGDGFGDIIIGADAYDHEEWNEGIALIFLGSAAGLSGSGIGDADALIEGNQKFARLGNSVASAGDVNGDGYADVVVGASEYSNGENAEGIAVVFHGSALGITGSSPADADALIEADQEFARLGWQVTSAGDVNGDGFADIAVSAVQYDNGEQDEGIAMVFLGSPAGIVGSGPGDAHALIEANQEGAILSKVASAGDVNGDGFADVIVGAYDYANGEDDEGIALVFHGSAAGITGSNPSDADALIEADQVSAWLGWSVASAGDVNSDGYADIVVGARDFDNGEDDEG